MRDLFIAKRYGLLPDRSNDYDLEQKLLQFAIMAGRRGRRWANRPPGLQSVGQRSRDQAAGTTTPTQAEKGGARSGESTVIFASLLRLNIRIVICLYIRQPLQTCYQDFI